MYGFAVCAFIYNMLYVNINICSQTAGSRITQEEGGGGVRIAIKNIIAHRNNVFVKGVFSRFFFFTLRKK